MVALTDTIKNVTGQTVTAIQSAYVRSLIERPSYTGAGLISTQPVEISENGTLSVDLEPGPAVLVVRGHDFQDKWDLIVEEGQITIRDAVVTVPGELTQHEVTVLRTLLDGALDAAADADTAKGQAESAAQATSGDRSHIDQVRDELDAAFDASTAGNVLPPRLTEPALNATYALKGEAGSAHSANSYGADPGATWQTNRDAFQAANDAARDVGGGTVTATPGIYTVKGVFQDSHVSFDLPGVTLEHPDGLAPDVLRGREHKTTGTTSGTTLTVADPTGIEVGSIVTVRGTTMHYTQQTTLSTGINATQTTGITLVSRANYRSNNWVMCGSEVIQHFGIGPSGELIGVTRGAFGTTAAPHAAGDRIGMAARHYALVVAVNGSTITLDTAPPLNVSGAEVTTGVMRPRISGVQIIGNRVQGGSPSDCSGIRWDQARYGSLSGVQVDNAEGGVMLRAGTSDCSLDDVTLIDCGAPEVKKGSSFWMFQGCRRNLVSNLTITGDVWASVYLDDRTTTADEFDAPNTDNTFTGFSIRVKKYQYNTGIVVVGSDRNRFIGGVVEGMWTGLSVSTDQAQLPGDEQSTCVGNEFASMMYLNNGTPWILNTPGNMLHAAMIFGAAGQPQNAGNSLVYAASESSGQPPSFKVTFPNGTQSAPSVSFAGDQNTGIFLQAKDMMTFTAGTNRVFRVQPNNIYIEDGKDISVQSGTGTKFGMTTAGKLAFYGATPVARQSGTPVAANDLGSALALVNDLRTKLVALGLIA